MMTAAPLLILLAGAVQAAAPASKAPAPVIKRPDWASRPSGEDFADNYPEAAAERGVGGKATLLCRVRIDGRLNDCKVVEESPPGECFGEAAMKLAPKFRMTPMTRDGVPVDGATVRIPLSYNPPQPGRSISKDEILRLMLMGTAWLWVVGLGGLVLLVSAYRRFGRPDRTDL